MSSRNIAIFTDCHALLEPLEAILKDIKNRNIKEVYSLGDNIGLGPNPNEVLDLLKENNIQSIAGNYEDYINLGIEPFYSYMTYSRIENINWMNNCIPKKEKEWIRTFPHFIELECVGKKIALVHFANDVRFDFKEHSAIYYPEKVKTKKHAYKQFLYTNSYKELQDIAKKIGYPNPLFCLGWTKKEALRNLRNWAIKRKENFPPEYLGYISYIEDPLFYSNGKLLQTSDYDAIIGGHVHFKIVEETPETLYYSTRGVAMGYKNREEDLAHYIILQEEENGYSIEEVYVPYNKEKMKNSILSLKVPNETIRRYTNI